MATLSASALSGLENVFGAQARSVASIFQQSGTLTAMLNAFAAPADTEIRLGKPGGGTFAMGSLANGDAVLTIAPDMIGANVASNPQSAFKAATLLAHELGHVTTPGGALDWNGVTNPVDAARIGLNAEGVALTQEYLVANELNAALGTEFTMHSGAAAYSAIADATGGSSALTADAIAAGANWAASVSPSTAELLNYSQYYQYQYALGQKVNLGAIDWQRVAPESVTIDIPGSGRGSWSFQSDVPMLGQEEPVSIAGGPYRYPAQADSAATAGGDILPDAPPGAVAPPDAFPPSPPGAQESVAAADQSVVETRLGAPESGNALPDSSLAVEPAPVSGNAAGPDTLSVTEPNGTATPEFAAEAPAVAVDGGAVEAGAGTPGTLGTVFGAAALVGGTAFDLYSGASIAGQYGLGSTQFMNWAVKSGPTELGTWGAAAIGYSAAIGDGASVFGAIGSGVGLAGEAFGPAAVLGSLAQIGYGAYQDINSGKSVFSWNSNAGVALDGNKYALIGAGIGTLVEPGGGTGIGYAIGAALDFGTAYHTNWLNQNPAQGLANQLNSNAYNESMAGAPEPDPMSGITYGFTPAPRSYFTATPTDSFGYQSVIQDAGTPNERVVQTFFVGWQSPSNAPGPWPGATTDYGVDGTATAPPADPLIARGISTMADVYALDRVQQAEAAAENPPANPANAAAPPSPAASAPQDAPSSPAPAPAWWNSPALTSDLGSGSSDTGNGQIGDGTASAIGTTPRRRATAPETRRRRTRLLAVSAAVARGTVQKRETKC